MDTPRTEIHNEEFDNGGCGGHDDSLWLNHGEKLPGLWSKIPEITKPRGSFRQFRSSNFFLKKHRIDGSCISSFISTTQENVEPRLSDGHASTRFSTYTDVNGRDADEILLEDDSLEQFLSSVSYSERIKVINDSLAGLNTHLFETKNVFKLLMSEVTVNGMRGRYFQDKEVKEELIESL